MAVLITFQYILQLLSKMLKNQEYVLPTAEESEALVKELSTLSQQNIDTTDDKTKESRTVEDVFSEIYGNPDSLLGNITEEDKSTLFAIMHI